MGLPTAVGGPFYVYAGSCLHKINIFLGTILVNLINGRYNMDSRENRNMRWVGDRLEASSAERLELMRRLDESFRQVRRQINAEWNTYNVHGLGMTHGRMLTILAQSGAQKASALAEQLLITSGGVTGIADRLIELGYVKRERGEKDRRVVMLDITEAGLEIVKLIETIRMKMMHRLFDGMSIANMEQGLYIFEHMSKNMETDVTNS